MFDLNFHTKREQEPPIRLSYSLAMKQCICQNGTLQSILDINLAPATIIGPIIGFQVNETTQTIFILLGLILITVWFRIIFANIPPKFAYHRYVPESAVVILLGIVLGFVIRGFQEFFGIGIANPLLEFNGDLFFVSIFYTDVIYIQVLPSLTGIDEYPSHY